MSSSFFNFPSSYSYDININDIETQSSVYNNESVFKCDCSFKNKKYILHLTQYSLYLTKYDNTKEIEIELENVVCTSSYINEDNYIDKSIKSSIIQLLDSNEQKYIKHSNKSHSYCLINYIQIQLNDNYKWRMKPLLIVFDNEQKKVAFTNNLNQKLAKFTNRPKSLIVFVNPISGHKKAVNIYIKTVKPIFKLAKIQCHLVITDSAAHAHRSIQELNLDEYDGIISVGGDGFFSECFSSLIQRTQMDNHIDYNNESIELKRSSKAIGIIPAGSTDAAAYCTTGSNDVLTSVYQIVLGKKLNIDVMAVYNNARLLKYCTTLLGYGYFGDIAHDSSKLRFLGPLRYVVCGIKNVLRNRSYAGKIRFNKNQIKGGITPINGQLCVASCKICSSDDNELASLISREAAIVDEHRQYAEYVNDSFNSDEINIDTNLKDNGNGIVEISGEFIGVNCVNMSCRCAKSKYGISPLCHTSNGCADLVLVRKTSRFNYIRYLLKLSTNALSSFADLPFVEVYRLKEFEFETGLSCSTESQLNNSNDTSIEMSDSYYFCGGSSYCLEQSKISKWNCDGEILDTTKLKAKVHRQLLTIYANGLHVDSKLS